MNKTGIAWAWYTLNPIVGCSHKSPACEHCYAEAMMKRLAKMNPSLNYSTLPWTKANAKEVIRFFPDRLNKLDLLQRRGDPGPVFLNSMSDIFHEDVPDEWRVHIFEAIRRCPDVVCIILTKRPEQATLWHDWPSNLWFVATVENRRERHRIPTLQSIPARIKGLSCEPVLESLGELDLTGLHWVIVGGESGPEARSMEIEWVREIQRQCHEEGVAFFMKQLSSHHNPSYANFAKFPCDLQERAYPEPTLQTWHNGSHQSVRRRRPPRAAGDGEAKYMQ